MSKSSPTSTLQAASVATAAKGSKTSNGFGGPPPQMPPPPPMQTDAMRADVATAGAPGAATVVGKAASRHTEDAGLPPVPRVPSPTLVGTRRTAPKKEKQEKAPARRDDRAPSPTPSSSSHSTTPSRGGSPRGRSASRSQPARARKSRTPTPPRPGEPSDTAMAHQTNLDGG